MIRQVEGMEMMTMMIKMMTMCMKTQDGTGTSMVTGALMRIGKEKAEMRNIRESTMSALSLQTTMMRNSSKQNKRREHGYSS